MELDKSLLSAELNAEMEEALYEQMLLQTLHGIMDRALEPEQQEDFLSSQGPLYADTIIPIIPMSHNTQEERGEEEDSDTFIGFEEEEDMRQSVSDSFSTPGPLGVAKQEIQNRLPIPQGSKQIRPQPGFCIKTHTSKKEKIFINICKSSQIPAAPDLSEQELVTILESDDPSGYRVPMSIGEPHVEVDNSGSGCTAYDIVINSSFFDKIKVFYNISICNLL
ncbi:hypothetical protein AB205_0205510, partial [Aquarana catesbeiana]